MIKSRTEVDPEVVKKFNEEQIWTATFKGQVISGTLSELRKFREASNTSK